MSTGFPVDIHRDSKTGVPFIIVEKDAFEHIISSNSETLMIPSGAQIPQGAVTSRFLAKVALEAMAERLKLYPEGLEYLVNEEQLDPIRNHARRGDIKEWPVYIRYIYNENQAWIDDNGEKVQLLHETDIFQTDQGELYFVMAIFGMEFTINYGGPFIEGYKNWLDQNNQLSPLYSAKNSAGFPLRASDE
jgi:hypothetical protein